MSAPEFSIIIPTYNRPEQLDRCLDALTELETARARFEVIVADDHGTTSAEPVSDAYRDRLNLVYHRLPENRGPAVARNRGAEFARGRMICFTDDDCRPAPDWLRVIGEHLRGDERIMVGGHTINALTDNAYAEASQLLIDYLYENLVNDSGEPLFFTSNNMALSVDRFREIGGFDETIAKAASEDREISHRFAKAGGSLRYEPRACVYHEHRMGFRGYWKQHFWYGCGALGFRRRLRNNNLPPPKVEKLAFYAGMMAYPYSKMGWLAATRCSALLALSQVAHIAGVLRYLLIR